MGLSLLTARFISMKKPELLAPAGNADCMLAAINAGADAIYVGTDRFSARAYADNVSDEALVKNIKKAHLCGVKVYLTLNTLLRDDELEDALDLLEPLYESGLDGVIVQDLGLAGMIRSEYPLLPLHASTQMSIMHSDGAMLCRELGFTRVVPARELTLDEIALIKLKTGMELECFIHGAMCYSYSGLCLMSSMIGGRSGNRGRCAGTCRLPFDAVGPDGQTISGRGGGSGKKYLLSMKDLCTVEILPGLMRAGIDSFKIEGRMKSAEYVGGVTAIYRKYVDLLVERGEEGYAVSADDLRLLRSLYVRTDISRGYYEGKKGRHLITMNLPGYNGSDRDVSDGVNGEYVHEVNKPEARVKVTLRPGEESRMEVSLNDVTVTVTGSVAEKARSAPVTEENVIVSMKKTGDSLLKCGEVTVETSGDPFMPISALNELRRRGFAKLEDALTVLPERAGGRIRAELTTDACDDPSWDATKQKQPDEAGDDRKLAWDVSTCTFDQLEAVMDHPDHVDRLILDHGLYASDECSDLIERAASMVTEGVWVSLPAVRRHRDDGYNDELIDRIASDVRISGVMVHVLDELAAARLRLPDKTIYLDSGVYAFNARSAGILTVLSGGGVITASYEARLHDLHELTNTSGPVLRGREDSAGRFAIVAYGRIPVMVSDGCVKKTLKSCDHVRSFGRISLVDRKNARFPVVTDCDVCTNVIYNSVPLSLRNMSDRLLKTGVSRFRINLTTEDSRESAIVLGAYLDDDPDSVRELSGMPHTSGHLKRGVL